MRIGGLSGSLQSNNAGSSYLVAGDNVAITSASNGQVTISTQAAAGLSSDYWYSIVQDASTATRTTVVDVGGYTTGVKFIPRWTIGQDMSIAGVKFYAKYGSYPRTIKVKLYNSASSLVSSSIASVAEEGIVNATFAIPYTFTSTDYGKEFTVCTYEISDTDNTYVTYWEIPGNYMFASPRHVITHEDLYGSGDVIPTTHAAGGKSYPVEPILYPPVYSGPAGPAGASGADPVASYVVLATTSSLPNERVLTAGTGLTRTDAGAGGNVTLAINNGVVATVSGTTFTGPVKIDGAYPARLYMKNNLYIDDNSAGIIIGDPASSTVYGIIQGQGDALTWVLGNSFANPVFAFQDDIKFLTNEDIYFASMGHYGYSGSHTTLYDGKSYLVAGDNVTITSQSNGQVVIAATVATSETTTYGHNPIMWEEVAGKTIPAGRRNVGYTVVGEKAYIYGGYDAAGSTTNSIYTASLSDLTTWGTSPNSFPVGTAYTTVIRHENYLYMFGGTFTAVSEKIYSASIARPDTWSDTGYTIPEAINAANITVVDDKFVILGGNTGAGAATNKIFSASITSPLVWGTSPNVLPVPAKLAALVNDGNSLCLYGGVTTGEAGTTAIQCASVGSPDKWKQMVKTLDLARYGMETIICNDTVYLFGGLGVSWNAKLFTAPLDRPWEITETLSDTIASTGIRGCAIFLGTDGYVYLVGGQNNGGGALDKIYRSTMKGARLSVPLSGSLMTSRATLDNGSSYNLTCDQRTNVPGNRTT